MVEGEDIAGKQRVERSILLFAGPELYCTHLSSQLFQHIWFEMHTAVNSSNDKANLTLFDIENPLDIICFDLLVFLAATLTAAYH